MRVFILKILPALPTVILAVALSPDFDGIVYRLYLGFLLFYLGFIILAAIGFLIFLGIHRSLRAPSVAAWLILLISSITLMPLSDPVEKLFRNHSNANRVNVFVTRIFEPGDRFEYVITAQGRGGWDAFQLHSGFTNIIIDGDNSKGSSLNYRLKPDIHLLENSANPCGTPTRLDPVVAFDQGRLPGILSVRDFHEFMTILETFSSIQSKAAFDREFQNPTNGKAGKISLQPDENVVYRTCFLLICAAAIVISFLLTAVPAKMPSSQEIPAGRNPS